MKEEYKKMGTIRGTRHAVELTKEVKGMPGFAPEYYDVKVCDVVYKFPHGEGEPYAQFHDSSVILDESDVQQILNLLKASFDESKFKFEVKDEE